MRRRIVLRHRAAIVGLFTASEGAVGELLGRQGGDIGRHDAAMTPALVGGHRWAGWSTDDHRLVGVVDDEQLESGAAPV